MYSYAIGALLVAGTMSAEARDPWRPVKSAPFERNFESRSPWPNTIAGKNSRLTILPSMGMKFGNTNNFRPFTASKEHAYNIRYQPEIAAQMDFDWMALDASATWDFVRYPKHHDDRQNNFKFLLHGFGFPLESDWHILPYFAYERTHFDRIVVNIQNSAPIQKDQMTAELKLTRKIERFYVDIMTSNDFYKFGDRALLSGNPISGDFDYREHIGRVGVHYDTAGLLSFASRILPYIGIEYGIRNYANNTNQVGRDRSSNGLILSAGISNFGGVSIGDYFIGSGFVNVGVQATKRWYDDANFKNPFIVRPFLLADLQITDRTKLGLFVAGFVLEPDIDFSYVYGAAEATPVAVTLSYEVDPTRTFNDDPTMIVEIGYTHTFLKFVGVNGGAPNSPQTIYEYKGSLKYNLDRVQFEVSASHEMNNIYIQRDTTKVMLGVKVLM